MNKQELLDHFAAAALTGLISKLPLYDSKGTHGEPIDDDELQTIRKEIAATAYNYASWAMIAREEFKDWLKKNTDQNQDFGS